MGENGVVRRTNNIYVGVDGVTRSILQGFNAVGSARRQFFGRLDDISYVELILDRTYTFNYTSDTTIVGMGGGLAIVNQYGSVNVSGTTFRVTCNTVGKEINLYGSFYAHFQDGHEHDLSYLTSRVPEYGAPVSFTANWVCSITGSGSSWRLEGSWLAACCGTAPNQYVDGYASGSFVPDITDNTLTILAGIKSGYGSSLTTYTEMTLPSYITIDGHSIPLVINNQLT